MERSLVNRPQGKMMLSSSLRFLFYVLFYIPLPLAGEGEGEGEGGYDVR